MCGDFNFGFDACKHLDFSYLEFKIRQIGLGLSFQKNPPQFPVFELTTY